MATEIYVVTVEQPEQEDEAGREIIIQRNDGQWYDEKFTEIDKTNLFSDMANIISRDFRSSAERE